MNTSISLNPSLFALVDEAGAIDAEIKRLEKQLETLKGDIKKLGNGEHTGFTFTAKVSESTRSTTDWQAIALKLNPSRQLITAHTSDKTIVTLKFSKGWNHEKPIFWAFCFFRMACPMACQLWRID